MAREMKYSGIEWIGEIPSNWGVHSAKYHIDIENGSDPKTEGSIPVYGSGTNSFKTCGEYKEGPAVLIGRKGSIDNPRYIEHRFWNVDTAFNVKAKNGFLLRYYYYLALSFDYKYYISQTTLPSMTQTNYENMSIPVPSFDKQKIIASFLDSRCAEIDKAVEATNTSIEEYKKLKQAIITEAVTKGLDSDVEMKDSGIEWIWEIPKHWDVTKIGKSFSLRDEKNYKSEDETQLLSLYTGRGVFPTGDEGTINSGNHAQTVIGYKVVKKDDIVVNIILAWMGAIGISEYDGVVSPAYDVYIPNKTIVCPRFCHYLFRTTGIANECYRYGRGIMMMRWRTYSTEFKQIRIPLPPIREQMKIASYLDTKCAEIDSLIKSKEKLIEELTAYRKSLIYEYVTGKKEVPAV